MRRVTVMPRRNTHLAESAGGLSLPTLESLGLGHGHHTRRAIDGSASWLLRPVGLQEQGVDSLVGLTPCLTEDDGAHSRRVADEAALEDVFDSKSSAASRVCRGVRSWVRHISRLVHRLCGPTVVRPVMWPPMTKCGPPICCINGVGKHARR